MEQTLRVGLAGAGYWGMNLLRTFRALPAAQLTALSDRGGLHP